MRLSALARAVRGVTQKKPKLVILGSGWAGYRVLKDVDCKKYDVTMISPRNHLLFTPMLASSALGTVNQRSICQPIRWIISQRGRGSQYLQSSVTKIAKEDKLLHCVSPHGQGYEIPYDKLVIAVGCQPNDFNTPGVKEHALFMKETRDATILKDHVLARLEQATYMPLLESDEMVSEEEATKLKEALTFVIVGGGPTGVELAGELTDFLHAEGLRHYPHLKEYIAVHLFTYDVLAPFEKGLQDYAIEHLRKKQGVQIHLGAMVTQVEEGALHVKHGGSTSYIKYGTMVWCAGIKPQKFVQDYDCPMDESGRFILVDSSLRVVGDPDVFAIGDCATIEDNRLPQTAQVANQQGAHVAKLLNKGDDAAFEFENRGAMAYLGGFTALAGNVPVVGTITGFIGFAAWRTTYWFMQLSMRNRFMLSVDWTRTLIFGRDLTRFGYRSQID